MLGSRNARKLAAYMKRGRDVDDIGGFVTVMVTKSAFNHGYSGKLWGTFFPGSDVNWCLLEKDHGGCCVVGGQMPHCPAVSGTLILPSSDQQEPAMTPHKWLLPANKMDQLMVESFVCVPQ